MSDAQVEALSQQYLPSISLVMADPNLSPTERMILIWALADGWDSVTNGQPWRSSATQTAIDWWETKGREYESMHAASNERTPE